MATYVILYKYTQQGINNIKDAPRRVEAAKKAAAEAGITVKETLWLQGEYDFMAITEFERRNGGNSLRFERRQARQR